MFSYRILSFVFFFLGVLLTGLQAQNETEKESRYLKIFDEISQCEIDYSKGYEVNNLVFQKDLAHFTFINGTIYLVSKIENNDHILFFKGEGRFELSPALKIEKDQLQRFFNKNHVDDIFKSMVLFINEKELSPYIKDIQPTNSIPDNETNKLFKKSIEHLFEEDNKSCNSSMMKSLLENDINGYFHAHYITNEDEDFAYRINPYADEEVSFLQGHTYIKHRYYTTICQYPSSESKFLNNKKYHHDALKYTAKIILDGYNSIKNETEITFKNVYPDQEWMRVSLYEKLTVDSVLFRNKKLSFVKNEESSSLWIETGTTKEGETNIITIYSSGNIFERDIDDWIYLKDPVDWLPQVSDNNYAAYDVLFKYPSKMQLVASGINVSNKIKDEFTYSRWITAKDQRSFSFNLGFFKEFNFEKENMPKITVLHAKHGHRGSADDMEEVVGTDIINCTHFFQENFGKLNLDNLYISEIPYYHGQAFPRLIHLSFSTFTYNDSKGYDVLFRAHEVAHQWWGISVDYENYHDKWLAEAFAEYSGLWFLQAVEKDNEKFFDILDSYKNSIFNTRKYLLGDGQESGPIYLGYRTAGKETSGDYSLIIYKKGAWVLHMLRMMMLDQKNMNEDRFIKIMQHYYKKFNGKKASTEDFQDIVSRYCGEDMSWFFNQWIYNTYLPVIDFSYNSKPADDGKYIVKIKVKLEDAPQNYKLYMPLYIDFGNGQFVRTRIVINSNEEVYELPLLPLNPEEIRANDLESVLCEINYLDWDEE